MLINGVGALATGLTTCVVLVAKFVEGAWITALAIPGVVLLMSAIHKHYAVICRETDSHVPARLKDIEPPIVVLPLQRWSRIAEKALRFAYTLSEEVVVLHVAPEDENRGSDQDDLKSAWSEFIEGPARQAGFAPPELVVLRSPYRFVLTPIFEHILELERKHPKRTISVLVPELVERQWYHYLLHNQRSAALKFILYVKGNGRIIVINIPWYLRS
jgi:hypothetical protein